MRVSTLVPIIAALPSVFGAPKQPPLKNGTAIPKHYGILAFPTFQPLDIFGPVDVLQSFSLLYNQTGMHLSVISATMEPVNSASRKTARMNMTHGSFGSSISVTDTMKQVLSNGGKCGGTPTPAHPGHPAGNAMDDIEVLIVPGGGGTRENLTEEIAFVKTMYPKVKYIISVCTGSTILARAGILDGKKATSNKRAWAWATSTGPKVNWVGEARWTQDGNIWTSSGIAAGIDATYAWIGHLVGNDVADYLAMSAEYERVTDPNHDPFAKIWDVPTSKNGTTPSGTGIFTASKVVSTKMPTGTGMTYRPTGTGITWKPSGTGVSSKSKKPCGGHGTSEVSSKVAMPTGTMKPSVTGGMGMSMGHPMPSSSAAMSSKSVMPSGGTAFVTIKPSMATPSPSAVPGHPHGGNYGTY